MHIIDKIINMQDYSDEIRKQDKTIALVPTMGYLHEGHLSLLRQARKKGNCVALSIFVNPTQFGPNEDFEVYPRNMERDLGLAEQENVDVVFTPDTSALYGNNYQTYVSLEKLPNHLCGLSRPVFFRGVATVVTKLFNIIKPHIALFGQKDYQQLMVIRQMVRDLNFDIEIMGCPIVRESDGLAMSSRNTYLSEEQRPSALSLYSALVQTKQRVKIGELNAKQLINGACNFILSHPKTEIDYIKICDLVTLEDIDIIKGQCLMALAVKVGKVRLIDNMII
ncbi:Pantothenate synthetase [Candidatus Magnetomoraceae bacterium gMMP-15]